MKSSVAPKRSSHLVSVVVATVDRGEMLRRCLDSLVRQEYSPTELIVVDNGSIDRVEAMVQSQYPRVRVIRNEENLGFSGGYNAGMRSSRGEFIAVLNDDATASPGWLTAMVDVAESDPAIGTVGSIVLDANRPGILDSCGVGIALDGMSRQAMKGLPPPQFTKSREVLLVSGCACLFRAEALRAVGFFDEDFFAYCEDTDLGLRLQWAGWKAAIAAGAIVTHSYSMTGGKFSLNKVYWVERNRLWVAIKNFPVILLPLVPLATLWRYALQMFLLIRGVPAVTGFVNESGLFGVVVAMLRAYGSALQGLPHMVGKRLGFNSPKKRSSLEMCKLILAHRMRLIDILKG